MSGRSERPGERQPIRFNRDVVVPDSGAGEAAPAKSRKAFHSLAPREHPAAWQAQRRRHASIVARRDDPVEQEARAHRRPAAEERAVEGKRELQRAHGVRRDLRQGPALEDRLARAGDVERLEIAQPAVDRPQVVERAAASEVGALDQRDRQPPCGSVGRDRQPVNAAAHDEHVVGSRGESVDVALHAGGLALLN